MPNLKQLISLKKKANYYNRALHIHENTVPLLKKCDEGQSVAGPSTRCPLCPADLMRGPSNLSRWQCVCVCETGFEHLYVCPHSLAHSPAQPNQAWALVQSPGS